MSEDQQHDPAQVEAWRAQAMEQEQEHALQASLQAAQVRAVTLNVEVRARDARIAALEAEKRHLEDRLNDFLGSEGGDPDADQEESVQ